MYKGLEDFESAYEYAKDNYEQSRENAFYIQSYFEIIIHMPENVMRKHMPQIEEMKETINRINKNNPTDFYYQINALYAAVIEKDEERAQGFLYSGMEKYPRSLYLARTYFDFCDSSKDIAGMEKALSSLREIWGKDHARQAWFQVRSAVLDAYQQKPMELIRAKIDGINGITPDTKERLKSKTAAIQADLSTAKKSG